MFSGHIVSEANNPASKASLAKFGAKRQFFASNLETLKEIERKTIIIKRVIFKKPYHFLGGFLSFL